jgi:hypothetical protein
MDACINVSYTNAIYKHVYHGNDIKDFLLTNVENNFFFTTCNFFTCRDKNTISDSMIPFYFLKKEVWWCGILFDFILIWDFTYSCYNFKIKNYLLQHVTIWNDYKTCNWFLKKSTIPFLSKPYKLHINQFCSISLKT